jgi:hypothetical protein
MCSSALQHFTSTHNMHTHYTPTQVLALPESQIAQLPANIQAQVLQVKQQLKGPTQGMAM